MGVRLAENCSDQIEEGDKDNSLIKNKRTFTPSKQKTTMGCMKSTVL